MKPNPIEFNYASERKCTIIILNWLELRFDNVAFDPHSNAGSNDEGDDVGDEEGEHNLGGGEPLPPGAPLPLPGGGDRALGGNTALELPLLGRQDVGSGAPVPDEVRHLLSGQPRLPESVDVDATTRVSHRGALCEILKEII